MDESFLVKNKIPIRNVWFLFLYAHDLAKFQGRFDSEVEESSNFVALIARLLCHVVSRRLKRNLSFGYRIRSEDLTRVRGRIDTLRTESHKLLHKGRVACRFEEFTVDTPRNRLVRAALVKISQVVDKRQNSELVERAHLLAGTLERIGVSRQMPSSAELVTDQIARHQSEDKLMVSLALAVFDLILPTEQQGSRSLLSALRNKVNFNNLFEKAVGNFYRAELEQEEWAVSQGQRLNWNIEASSDGFNSLFPSMQTDIVLRHSKHRRKIVIDTKFKDILGQPRFENRKFHSANIYQMYAYLRSQEAVDDPYLERTEGILLYPTIGHQIDEAGIIDGHILRLATIDLSAPTEKLIKNLRELPFRNFEWVEQIAKLA